MTHSLLEKNPRFFTFIFSLLIVGIFLSIIFKFLTVDILQDYEGGEKYSLYEKMLYQIRCNGERSIRLRELKPNANYTRIPHEHYETLEYKKYELNIDENGIIKPSFIHKNPDLQIFFLGGSTTECEFVDPEFRFPYLVGRIMEKKTNLKINSDNAAKSGNNSLHSIDILLNKIIPMKPDIVVMMHNINDLSALFYEGSYWNDNKTIAPITCSKKNRDELIKDDQWNLSGWQEKIIHSKEEQQRIILDFEQNLEVFISILKAKNITPVLMTQANRIEFDPNFKTERGKEIDDVYQKLYAKFNQSIREVASKNKVLLIDLAKKVPSDKNYIYDVVHFNKDGSIKAANEIAQELEFLIQKMPKKY